MIIDSEELENAILEIEGILMKHDFVEQGLILQQVSGRRAAMIQKQKVRDTVDGHPMMKFANKFMKDKGGGN